MDDTTANMNNIESIFLTPYSQHLVYLDQTGHKLISEHFPTTASLFKVY